MKVDCEKCMLEYFQILWMLLWLNRTPNLKSVLGFLSYTNLTHPPDMLLAVPDWMKVHSIQLTSLKYTIKGVLFLLSFRNESITKSWRLSPTGLKSCIIKTVRKDSASKGSKPSIETAQGRTGFHPCIYDRADKDIPFSRFFPTWLGTAHYFVCPAYCIKKHKTAQYSKVWAEYNQGISN